MLGQRFLPFERMHDFTFSRDQVMWLKNRSVQKLGGGWLEQFTLRLWSRMQLAALRARKDPQIVEEIWGIYRDKRSLLSAWEQYLIFSIARAQSSCPGAMAEVGVYRGGSAKLICRVKGDKPFYLFDTFKGLPPSSAEDRNVHREHQYECSLEQVQQYLHGFDNLHYYQGIFPDSAKDVPEQTYCFAHFDVDLYEGTKACLEYFYPRMMPGGIMVSHDFGLLAGVEKAFHEFFAEKPEQIIDLPSTQCMVVKS